MKIYNLLVLGAWIVFIIYWFISGLSAKKTTKRGQSAAIRIIAVIVAFLIASSPTVRELLLKYNHNFTNPFVNILGVILCFGGIGLAIYARRHLGRNWGMPMSEKVDAELVTSGPYSVIRHPIYTGIILATIGSVLTVSSLWLFFTILYTPFFIYSSYKEEERMLREFPGEYPAYMSRTKRLIPFIY